jgi:hypothetical protein
MTIFRQIPPPLLAGLLLLVYGLNIPVVSLYAPLAWTLFLLLAGAFKTECRKGFGDRLALLLLFAVSFYAFSTIHGITTLREALLNTFAMTGAYALGYSAGPKSAEEVRRTLPAALLFMVLGFACFSFLSVYSFLQSSGLLEIAARNAPSFWDGAEINAPGYGANASLAMCLLPVIFLARGEGCRGFSYWPVAAVIWIMFAAGVFVNAALQNRTPFLATAASFFLCSALYWYRHRSEPSRVGKKLALPMLLVVLLACWLAATIDPEQFTLLSRFSEHRLDSPRFETWKKLLGAVNQNLLGGRSVRLELAYVHNLWLDVFWDAGVVPFIFLVAFHLKHLSCFRAIVKSQLPQMAQLMIVAVATSFVMNFMQEPTLSASIPYFSCSCFFLGLVLRVSEVAGSELSVQLPVQPELVGSGTGAVSGEPGQGERERERGGELV